ncbi:MAG: HesA/MoeB/ThiF family protein [Elusimicrobiota bacterium]
MGMVLSERELERYDRQLMMGEIGAAGQEKLRKARIAVVGVGGLGSSAAAYLTAAGVGRITLVDPDKVELSNLNRQILHGEGDIGRPKVDSACDSLKALNGGVDIVKLERKLTRDNAAELLAEADALVDGLDNFAARFVLNEAAAKLRKPYFHGACRGFEGRVMTVLPGETACLRCVFPTDPPEQMCPVLGTTPGIIGTMLAMEAIKHLTGAGDLLAGRLLIFDGKSWESRLIRVPKDPACPVCGGGPR